jgi:hypothetical protein
MPLNRDMPESSRSPLRELRIKLLALHKELLEVETRNFERVFGRVNSGELLQLVINHPQFAWLQMISAVVVQIDEMLAADEPAPPEEIRGLISQTNVLLTSSDNSGFREKYQRALQNEPGVVLAHSEVMKLLRQKA